MELEPVQHVWINHDNDLVDVTLTATVKSSDGKIVQKNEVLHTNEKHPFLTKEKGFVPVSQLKPGMHVLEANGQYGIVAKLVVVSGSMWMYNLQVAQDHTYTVGLEHWIVHNCGKTGTPDPANKVAGQPDLYEGQRFDPDELSRMGYKRQPGGGVPDYQKSEPFAAYIKSLGQKVGDWNYYMETWVKKGAQSIKNHYWGTLDPEAEIRFYHHH